MAEVTVQEAKSHRSPLSQRVAAGEEFVIAHAGVPTARSVRIVPVDRPHAEDSNSSLERSTYPMTTRHRQRP